MRGLGRLYDIGSQVVPVADTEVALTGHRVHLKNYSSATFVVYYGAVSAGTDAPVIDLQQHTAATSGTSADCDVITEYYIKFETTLDGDEVWTRVTQSAASEITLTGATYAATQLILVFEVDAAQLSDGYEWVSVDQADPGSGGTRPGGILVIMNEPAFQRRPDALPQPNA
jgi:hypothetical protein